MNANHEGRPRPLKLTKETLRVLTAGELHAVAGGFRSAGCLR
jgi:hypothetical protein